MWVDSHCHLGMEQFDIDRDDVIESALSNGVRTILLPGTCKKDIEKNMQIAEKYPSLFVTTGIHPHEAGSFKNEGLEYVTSIIDSKNISGIGEIGLDFHYNFCDKSIQIEAFEKQVSVADKRDLPVVIHSREAFAETYRILKKYTGLRGEFHCFTYGREEAVKILDLGFYISFSGIITFKKGADGIIDALKVTPLENILIETDSPYLAPVPYRGKRNEPSYVVFVGTAVASLLNKVPEEIAEITKENFFRLFKL